MMAPLLSFEQAPPISAPWRFFLTAPLFGVLAGLTLAWQGGEALTARWTPATLALTHLLTVGFMLQAMLGALLQFVPVAAGGNVWRPGVIATLVHPLLSAGALVLAAAFLRSTPVLFTLAAALLVPAILLFVLILGHALWRTPADGETLPALRLAVAALGVTVLLGGYLAISDGRHDKQLTDLHAWWGLGGWAFVLLAGVSWTVVPMFQLTPPYPQRLMRSLPPLALALLLALSVTPIWPALTELLVILASLLAAGQACCTLRLQQRRRRKMRDVTLLYFRAAMLALLAAMLALGGSMLWPENTAWPIWVGLLLLPGVFVCAIAGMLYKIVPFIAWLHLQRLPADTPAPNMHQMIAEPAMRAQLRLQLAALAMLLAAVLWPALAVPAGLTFAAACLGLALNLGRAMWRYRQFSLVRRASTVDQLTDHPPADGTNHAA